MAERRMFAKTIIESDAFLDMSPEAQCLYFHLGMMADDDGFINNPKRIMRAIGSQDTALRELAEKRFVLGFDSGVVVIKHWRINNFVRNDRYKETLYSDEMATLTIRQDGAYTEKERKPTQQEPETEPEHNDTQGENTGYTTGIPTCNHEDETRYTQDRLGKDRLGKDKEIKASGKPTRAHLESREPKNDLEEVEKHYLATFRGLFACGRVTTEKPVITNWGAIRALERKVIDAHGQEAVIRAIENATRDDWIVSKGFALTMILSSGVLNRLINARPAPPGNLARRTECIDIPEA
jgi:hypothetical protein